jgi:2-amino-4-hydroxy-6-hydroxymethyldihydropteridine diphosphokinase
MIDAYLGIGTNLGNREENIDNAILLLKENGIAVFGVSSLIETLPVGGPEGQELFLNACIHVKTYLDPHSLLKKLKEIEEKLGRVKTVVNGPRIIDLDILVYGDIKINSEELTIPHPRMMQRGFVLRPLEELNPELVKNLKDEDSQKNSSA